MEQRSDTELLQSYRKGDEAALTQLIQRYLSIVYGFIVRLTGEPAIAEELTQVTFIKMWKHLGRFDASRSFKSWIFSIARNTAIDYLRKKSDVPFSVLEDEKQPNFAETIEDPAPLPDEVLEKTDFIERALAQLPVGIRALILMHDVEGLTFEEIARATNEAMNTVKSRYRRAIERLRDIVMHQM